MANIVSQALKELNVESPEIPDNWDSELSDTEDVKDSKEAAAEVSKNSMLELNNVKPAKGGKENQKETKGPREKKSGSSQGKGGGAEGATRPRKDRSTQGPKLLKENELHIKNLEPWVDNTELHSLFSQFGNLTEVRVVRNKDDRSKGFALLVYKTAGEAKRAMTRMNNHKIGERNISIALVEQEPGQRSTPQANPDKQYKKDTIFVRNLDKSVEVDQLKSIFVQFGKIIETKVLTDENGQSKGMGIVHFFSYKAAEKAILEMHGRYIKERPIFISLAELLAGKKYTSKPKRETLEDKVFIANLPDAYTDTELKALFARFGTIREAKCDPGKQGGFVQFVLPKDARKALSMNGHVVHNKPIKVNFCLSKPGQKNHNPFDVPKKLDKLNEHDDDYYCDD